MRGLTCPTILIALAACTACTGDDAHRQQTTIPPRVDAVPTPAISADAAVSPATATTTPPANAPAPLAEDMAKSYFPTGDAKAGADAFALRNWKDALAAFAKARAATKDDAQAARLDLMTGMCHAELGQWKDASHDLAAAAPKLPLVSDWLNYQLARALYNAHEPGAETTARKVAAGSIAGAEAEILVGAIVRDKNDATATAAFFRDYLARRPKGPHRSEARFELASALEISAPAEALGLYKQITVDDPLSSWATKATARAGKLPDPQHTRDHLTAAEQMARAHVLFEGMRNPESEAAFDAALASPDITPLERCDAAYNRAQSHFKARKYTESGPMFDAAAVACKASGTTDLEIKSNYQAGRSYAYGKDHALAAARYRTAEGIDPKHSYADDAMLREAEEYTSMGDDAKVIATLSALPGKFPDGDNVAEAEWRLGWHAWRKKDYPAAIAAWKDQVRLVPHDDNYFGEGQAQYWLGRAYAATNKPKDAIASWRACVREYPAAYYALLSLNRLREAAPKDFATAQKEMAADPPGYDPKQPAFAFQPRTEWGAPGFARAMELMRLGLGEPAEQELHELGLTPPEGKKRVDDPDRIDKLWAIAFLYDRAGRYATSHWPTRWHILDYRRGWPTGKNRARWEIAYPKAYWELLNRHADLNKVPIAMQIAIVREESAFDPLDESYANAIGLTQMIPPTAADFSKGTGIDPTRENLRDPEKNVTIGSRFLGSLWKKWKGFTLLVPPSYNAGPAGVTKMLRARGTWDADEFVEGIIDDQARNYTKRVLGTFFTYTWLYQHEVPTIPNTIPADILPRPAP